VRIVNKFRFYIGISIVFVLLFGYFLKIEVDSGANYAVNDTLLGIIIFHNLFIFIIYLLIALFFIFTGFRKVRIL